MMEASIEIKIQVMITCAVPDMKRGFFVIILFLDPASIRAILFVFVTSAEYIMAKLNPGKTLETKQVAFVGFARSVKVVP